MGVWFFNKRMELDNMLKRLTACEVWRLTLVILNVAFLLLMLISILTAQTAHATEHHSIVCVYGEKIGEPGSIKYGVGFLVNKSGYIVTAKHVVDSLQTIIVKQVCNSNNPAIDTIRASVYSSDTYDIAVIQVNPSRIDSRYCYPCSLADDATVIVGGILVEGQTYDLQKDKSRPQDIQYVRIQKAIFPDTLVTEDPLGCSGTPVFFYGTDILVGYHTTWVQVINKIELTGYQVWIHKPPYGEGVHVGRIKNFLRENNISFAPAHFERIELPKHGKFIGNPVRVEEKSWFIGMLDLIKSSIQDILQGSEQFKGKDADILIETYFETSSFLDKISNTNYTLTDEKRQKAIFCFSKGLAIKVSQPDGIEASRQYFERAVYEDSSFADARYQIALYHLRCTGDSSAAINHLRKALEFEPENREVLRALGIYYLRYPNQDPNHDLAKKYLEKADRLLPKDDPRIPYYLGLLYDPYWSVFNQLADSVKDFRNKLGKKPSFTEVQNWRKAILAGVRRRDDSLKVAIRYYEESMSRHPGYIRPLNAIIWDFTNEVIEYPNSDSFHNAMGEKLPKYLKKMSNFVGYGLVDPRFFNTLALAFSAINDCPNSCEYWRRSMETMAKIELSPDNKDDLMRENERVSVTCSCSFELFEHKGLK